MPSSREPPEYGKPPEYGFKDWFLFLAAITATLTVCVGCTAWVYGPLFTG
ncbi:hypothetical protein NI17_002060 [Thermobifida halotolerans]|uniref:Uncharacterized protein n=1 Tax=Thermobifida halotolerans TaxID=483545 RepID=A0AA97LXK0_9ACTN|nr:hypothetical protein [Thermobifida halotolerans]UOE20062.1 hypothetical protein NI17_002060 [Thermobifida halotolerans]